MTVLVLHIPHSAADVPADARAALALNDEELAREQLRITDWFTDELFAFPTAEATTVRFPISRLIVDPERFVDDALEPMAPRGMGVIYTRTTNGEVLRPDPSAAERESLLERFYTPHHARLTAAVDAALAAHGECLIIDAHSFPDRPLPCHAGLYAEGESPDVCLGTDPFHTPPALAKRFARAFRAAGWTVDIDRPFAGTLVPMKHYRRDRRVSSLMIELNRRLYMDERAGARLPHFDDVHARVLGCLHGALGAGP